MIPSIALSQDSLATVSLARWKVLQLIEIAQTAATCDSLQRYQDSEIRAGIRLQAATDSLLSLTTYQLVAAKADRGIADSQLKAQKALTKQQAKKKRKWIFVSCGIVALWVGTVALGQ